MTKPPSPRPLSIKVFVGLHVIAIIGFLGDLRAPQLVFGFSLSGIAGIIARLMLSMLYACLATALWYLSDVARRVVIGIAVYDILNPALAISRGASTWFDLAMSLFLNVLTIWFLIKRKSAFVKSTTPTQAST